MSHSVRSTGLPNFEIMSSKRHRAAFIRFSAVRVAADDERRVVLPLVGIADLRRDRGELLARLGLGRVAHPVELRDALAVGRADGLDQVRVALLGRFREVLLDEDLAEHHAHRRVFGVEHALPARPLFLLAGEHAAGRTLKFSLSIGRAERRARTRRRGGSAGSPSAPGRASSRSVCSSAVKNSGCPTMT